jgi:hypothetical protein
VALSGCTPSTPTMTFGRPFDPSLLGQLRPGLSTVEDATRLFGQPEMNLSNAAGEHDLEWANGQATGGHGQVTRIAVPFGPDGRMIRVRGVAQNDDTLTGIAAAAAPFPAAVASDRALPASAVWLAGAALILSPARHRF